MMMNQALLASMRFSGESAAHSPVYPRFLNQSNIIKERESTSVLSLLCIMIKNKALCGAIIDEMIL